MNKLFQVKLNVKNGFIYWNVKLNWNVATVNCYVYNFSTVRLKQKRKFDKINFYF